MKQEEAIKQILRNQVAIMGALWRETDYPGVAGDMKVAIRETTKILSTLPQQGEKPAEATANFLQSCDVCGCHPSVIITTPYGTFCQQHVKYSEPFNLTTQ